MSKKQLYDPNFDRHEYLQKIQRRAERSPMQLAKSATKQVGKMLGIGSDKASPHAKETKTHSYVASKQQTNKSASKDIGNLTPSVTPANDYLTAKKKATDKHEFGNTLHKAKIPYNNRSRS